MFRDGLQLLEYERKRRPELNDLVGRISNVTDVEIDAANLLPWMRIALRQLRAYYPHPNLLAVVSAAIKNGFSDDPMGVVREWRGVAAFVCVGKNSLEMLPGQLIWLDRNGIWIDTVVTTHVDPQWATRTVFCDRMSRSQYNRMVRERARGLMPGTMEVEEPKPRFQIYRPK